MTSKYGTILDFDDSPSVTAKDDKFRFLIGKIILAIIVVVGVISAATVSGYGSTVVVKTFQSSRPTASTKAHSSLIASLTEHTNAAVKATGLQFTTYRDGYSPLEYFSESPSDFLQYKILDGYMGVIEPYANMYMKVYGIEGSVSASYTYRICLESDDCTLYEFTEPFRYECTPSETYHVKIYNVNEEEVASGSMLCLYVRREIRTLTKTDLDTAIEAIWKMWSTDQEDGEALYGSDFLNYARLLEYHYFNAGWQDADHIHEGKGFLPQHMKMIYYFSKSLTAVDPSVSLFYWDFTYEPAKGLHHWDGPIFTNETMGSLTFPANGAFWSYANDTVEAGAIPDSRWKNFQTDENVKFPDLRFGYGLMRSPWNMNPATFITRFTAMDKELPTCQSHYALTDLDDFADYLHDVLYAPHASTHGAFGGVFGCDLLDQFRDAGYTNGEEGKLEVCSQWVFHMEVMYRANHIVPKTDCVAEDENGDPSLLAEHQSCGFTCPEDTQDSMLNYLMNSMRGVPKHIDTDGYKAYREFICSGDGFKVFGGDHVESASPADPSFWPMHPTLERLLHAKIMSGFDMSEWPTEDICDYSTCYDSELGFGEWETCCYGHYEYDQLLDADNDDRTKGVGFTNREIIRYSNPISENYAMDYIYDGFTWDHCAEIGFDIVELLKSNRDEYLARR